MALSLNTIINFIETPFKIRTLAGKKGLSKTVSWVYYTENPETIEFIRGGELAITTCLNIERQKCNFGIDSDEYVFKFLKEFIDSFINHNASGLIINTGKYINSIPQAIIDYCNEMDFPLFSIPWEIHTIDLMQDIGNMISANNQKSYGIERFFYKAIFEPEDFDKKQLENTDFYDSKNFTITLIPLENNFFNNDFEQLKRYITISFNPRISVQQNSFCSFIHKQKLIYVIRDDSTQFIKELSNALKNDKYFHDLKFSVSDECKSVSELPEIYNHACVALNFSNVENGANYYNSLGVFKILADVRNPKTLENIYSDFYEKLKVLEEDKSEDYIKTLELFLKFGGNIQEVAEHNYIHRNTAIYRIKKLEEILGMNFSDGDTRCLIQIALYIRKYLKLSSDKS